MISFADFLIYVIEYKKRLELLYRDLDRNQDGIVFLSSGHICSAHLGYIDVKEIKNYCNELGIPLTDERAVSLVEQYVCFSLSMSINLSMSYKCMCDLTL